MTASFDDPLGLLRACHQRIRQHCEILLRLAEHLERSGADEDARKAAQQVHRYFSTAAKQHHQDEEVDVFPKLIRQSLKMADMIHGLKKEHAELDRLWAALEPQLRRLPARDDAAEFTRLAQELDAVYRRHMAVEENQFLDQAQHMLSRQQLGDIGRAMAERRGVKM
jgi:hemerythrin-like domain-containing protein